jgi:hypothetical protein
VRTRSAWAALRGAEKRAVRVQRRIWLAQIMLWVIGVAAVGTAALATMIAVRRRRAGAEIGSKSSLGDVSATTQTAPAWTLEPSQSPSRHASPEPPSEVAPTSDF